MIPSISEKSLWDTLKELIQKEIGKDRPEETARDKEERGIKAHDILKRHEARIVANLKQEGNICHALLQVIQKYPSATKKMGHQVVKMRKPRNLLREKKTCAKGRKERQSTSEERTAIILTAVIIQLIEEKGSLGEALEALVRNNSSSTNNNRRFTTEDLQEEGETKIRGRIRGLSHDEKETARSSLKGPVHNNFHQHIKLKGKTTTEITSKELMDNLKAPLKKRDRRLIHHAKIETTHRNFTITSEGARKFIFKSNRTEKETRKLTWTLLDNDEDKWKEATVEAETIDKMTHRMPQKKYSSNTSSHTIKYKCVLCSTILTRDVTFFNKQQHQDAHRSLEWNDEQKRELIITHTHILTP